MMKKSDGIKKSDFLLFIFLPRSSIIKEGFAVLLCWWEAEWESGKEVNGKRGRKLNVNFGAQKKKLNHIEPGDF